MILHSVKKHWNKLFQVQNNASTFNSIGGVGYSLVSGE